MAILTEAQAMADAAAAGFTGSAQQIIVAIARAESGLSTTATNTTGNSAGIDRGILQINSAYHPEVSNACAFDPVCAFKSAFNISSNGTNFTPWTTFTNGAYQQYLPSSSGETKQWYNFNIFSTFGEQDSEGNYFQPDANLSVPKNYPVVAGLSGIVTSIQNTSWGQNIVTIKLNTPLNSEATHIFFEHLGSSNVTVGQPVSPNTLIGYTGGPGNGVASLGVGLYSGDVYGSGSAWQQLQTDLAPGGPGLLNPTNLISYLNSGGTMGFSPIFPGLTPGTIPGQPSLIQQAIDPNTWLSDIFGSDAVQRGVIISVGLIVILLGIIILFFSNPQTQEAAKVAAM